ncbi:GNAT family N-acetyltransferase [Geitlerinema sp. CS-897]|nr:GNAT family N-acetyltransferase [Geitlerinema sp. CS-897]
MEKVTFREATLDDADALSDLILESQRQFCFHEYTVEGQELMNRVCGRKALRHYLERGDVYFVAESEGRIVGVAGIRDNTRLAHNFVDAKWHRRGISKRLWKLASEECLRRGNPGSFDLRASTYAIPIYEKWGFVQTAPTSQECGITSTPMKLEVTARYE